MITVKSQLNSDKVAYLVSESSMQWWDSRGNMDLLGNIGTFETYGDGTVQHSPAHPAQFRDLTDVCLSIAVAIMADPLQPEFAKLGTNFLYCYPKDALKFAYDLRYKEGKELYYSLAERNVTSGKSKQYDRRYEKIKEWMTGGAGPAFRIVIGDTRPDWLVRVWVASQLRDMSYERGDGWTRWEDVFSPVTELPERNWNDAFSAFMMAVKFINAREHAQSAVDCAVHNLTPRKEEVAA